MFEGPENDMRPKLSIILPFRFVLFGQDQAEASNPQIKLCAPGACSSWTYVSQHAAVFGLLSDLFSVVLFGFVV